MKFVRFLFVLSFFLMSIPVAHALKGVLASDQEIKNLIQDLVDGKVQTGNTRLSEIQDRYGDAASIDNTDKVIVYDYGKVRLDFEKKHYMRKWEYDYSHKIQYTNEIKKLRKDLADEKIVGNYIELIEKIKKDYKEPTEVDETFGDGQYSIYYYGEIKLTFENVITLKKWKAEDLGKTVGNVLTTSLEGKKEEPKTNTPQNTMK
ncbi:MAG: hypothetical protein HQL24_08305 [Candidatus Omnitrophica bacterium]|nr:hypothetical protein [Candidatus Omnitrophota bacterium]